MACDEVTTLWLQMFAGTRMLTVARNTLGPIAHDDLVFGRETFFRFLCATDSMSYD
jgi:ribosomal protein S28E/S33